ncbi:MAG TPA: hypothetical protein VJN02_00570 [Gammaproteobacteria bacterium]|nr:hypothetical protein [Gammaproteobacteria bacterium]
MRNISIQSLSDRNRLLMFIIASVVLLYFIFAPATHILYYGGEDFRYAVGGAKRLCKHDDGFYFMKTLGRPLQAYMDCIVYKFTHTLQQMIFIRILAVVMLGIGMGLLADWLYLVGFSFWIAFFASGSLFLIQKLYSDTILTGALSLPLPILFVILGYRCLTKAHHCELALDGTFQKEKIKYFVYASILFLLALLTYPAMTFFFGTLVLIKLLFSNIAEWNKTRREIVQEVILFTLVCFIYFAWASYNMRYHSQAPIPEQYRMHLNLSITELFNRARPLGNVFNGGPWVLLFPLGFPFGGSIAQGWLTILLLSGAVVCGFGRFIKSNFYLRDKIQALLTLIQIIIFVIGMLVFCSAFYLMIPHREDMGSRLIFASVASGFPLLFWSIYRWGEILSTQFKYVAISVAIGFIFFLEGYQANIKIMYDALHFAQTLVSVETQINRYLSEGSKLRRIHFVIPEPEFPYNKFFLANAALVQLIGHEGYEVKWCSLPRVMSGAEKDHQPEMTVCINALPINGIAVTYSRPGEPINKTTGMLMMQNTIEQQNEELRNLIA